MGSVVPHPIGRFFALCLAVLIIASGTIGCQVGPTVSVKKLEQNRELADLSGLKPAQIVEDLRVSWSIPTGKWDPLPIKKTVLYTHQQWRSPSLSTGIGVAHIQMPLPIPAQAVIWFAKNEYMRRAQDQAGGRLIGEWTDSLGRQWFEAENSKYHVKGYAIAKGTEAWIVYCGWRVTQSEKPWEIAVAQRSLDSVVPAN